MSKAFPSDKPGDKFIHLAYAHQTELKGSKSGVTFYEFDLEARKVDLEKVRCFTKKGIKNVFIGGVFRFKLAENGESIYPGTRKWICDVQDKNLIMEWELMEAEFEAYAADRARSREHTLETKTLLEPLRVKYQRLPTRKQRAAYLAFIISLIAN